MAEFMCIVKVLSYAVWSHMPNQIGSLLNLKNSTAFFRIQFIGVFEIKIF